MDVWALFYSHSKGNKINLHFKRRIPPPQISRDAFEKMLLNVVKAEQQQPISKSIIDAQQM